jgi:hypothetical protein
VRKALAAFLLLLGALSIPTLSPVAAAQPPQAQGWWWLYRRVDPPVSPKAFVPTFPDTPELPPPASVPADGLYVAGNPSGPEAVAALQWVIPEGASGTTLTLVAAAPLTPTTKIQLCPTTTNWKPEQAGAWRGAPLYQCASDAPVGVVPTDGAKITFTLGKLGQNQLIDVALVPVADQTSTFQANFNKPDANALTVKPGASADTSSLGGAGSNVLGMQNDPSSLNAALQDPSYLPTLAPALLTPTDQGIGAAPTVPFRENIAAPANTTAAPAAVKDQLQTFGMFGLFALALLFNRFRGQPAHEPTSLVRFGKREVEEVS